MGAGGGRRANDSAAPARPAAMAARGGVARADILLGVLVAAAEAVVLASAPGFAGAVAAHVLAVVALGLWLVRRLNGGGDGATASLMLIATAAAGPVGTIGSLVALGLAAGRGASVGSELLDDWYERISHSVAVDPVSRLCEQVSAGRALGLSSEPPASFWAVLDEGRIEQQQAVLGLIARRFDPKFLPLLARALASPVAIVRVQAAAVAARVRHGVEARAAELIGEANDDALRADRAVAVASELELYAQSGLCDQLVRAEAAARVDALLARHRVTIERELWRPDGRGLRGDPVLEGRRELLERYLVRAGEFASLRRLRSRRRVAGLGVGARIRPLGRTQRRVAGGEAGR